MTKPTLMTPPPPYPFASRNERAWIPPPTRDDTTNSSYPKPHRGSSEAATTRQVGHSSQPTTSSSTFSFTPSNQSHHHRSFSSREVHPPSSAKTTLSTPPSVTQAMRNDLEGLIDYIDGLAFQLSPEKSRRTTITNTENITTNQAVQTPSPSTSILPKQQKERSTNIHNSVSSNKTVFRDRSNQKTNVISATGAVAAHIAITRRQDPPDLTVLKQKHNATTTRSVQQQGSFPFPPAAHSNDRLEPTGYTPPIGDSSMYLQHQQQDDDSLSLILSKSSTTTSIDEHDGQEQQGHVSDLPKTTTTTNRNGTRLLNSVTKATTTGSSNGEVVRPHTCTNTTPRLLTQLEGRLTRIGTSIGSSPLNYLSTTVTTTDNKNNTEAYHRHSDVHSHHRQQPPGSYRTGSMSSSSNTVPLMDQCRVLSDEGITPMSASSSSPSSTYFAAASATARVDSMIPTPNPNRTRSQAQPEQTNVNRMMHSSSSLLPPDPTPMKKHMKVGNSIQNNNNVDHSTSTDRDWVDEYPDANNVSMDIIHRNKQSAVDATPRLEGKSSRRLVALEDPEGLDYDALGRSNTDHLEINTSTSSSSSGDIYNSDDKYALGGRVILNTPSPTTHGLERNSQRNVVETTNFTSQYESSNSATGDGLPTNPSPSSSGTVPDSARKLLRNAIDVIHEARRERQSARQWADDVKDEVGRWVSHQRDLIRTESLATTSPTSAGGTTTTSTSLVQLEQTIQNLHKDLARSYSSREDSDRKLEQLILNQAEHIRSMSSQLETMEEKLDNAVKVNSGTKPSIGKAKKTTELRSLTIPEESNEVNDIPSFIARTPTGDAVDMSYDNRTNNKTGTSQSMLSGTTVSSMNTHRIRRSTPNGGYVTEYSNGSIKEVHPDGTTVTRFPNGDVETRFKSLSPVSSKPSTPSSMSVQASPRGIVAYFYSKDAVLQISQRDGSKLFEYSNGQVEKHYPDGFKMILYPDGTKCGVDANGTIMNYQN